MTDEKPVEILLVEDNPNDAELMLRALKKSKLSNKVHVTKDGAEALDSHFYDPKKEPMWCNKTPIRCRLNRL